MRPHMKRAAASARAGHSGLGSASNSWIPAGRSGTGGTRTPRADGLTEAVGQGEREREKERDAGELR